MTEAQARIVFTDWPLKIVRMIVDAVEFLLITSSDNLLSYLQVLFVSELEMYFKYCC